MEMPAQILSDLRLHRGIERRDVVEGDFVADQ